MKFFQGFFAFRTGFKKTDPYAVPGAKGGVIFAIAQRLKLPIRFIGVGESAEDLRPFVASDFIRALFQRS